MPYDFSHFLQAQELMYSKALAEIRNGKKESHWIWFIFPQLKGLGKSEISKRFALENEDEARSYLQHPILGKRLREITGELLKLPHAKANNVFGKPDYLKLKSCMSLFASVDEEEDGVFERGLRV